MTEEEEHRRSRRYEFYAFETMIDAVINFETLFTSFVESLLWKRGSWICRQFFMLRNELSSYV